MTDLLHPCQIMADVMTIQEAFGTDLSGRKVAWVGDGNNMANSWLNAAYRFGFELRLACPKGYEPDKAIFDRARTAANVMLTHDPREAVEGADVVSTDVWASMGGGGSRAAARVQGYHDEALMSLASADAIFLHCLPAHRGGRPPTRSSKAALAGIRRAENRLHVRRRY